ncbi:MULTISPECIES: alpha/beta fold hydrolase [Streptomyces]|uniref:alpha/beta fold hydrolase n=1 Tax=Streptomyces TaxID=1883 RepID=UPI00163C6094|nr:MULTISPECIES: alpha/beta hydrolase [Streptomyces]MBC2874370.1 alpha/beta hydrolase [Streptomyces sp. TYQ1024]UBI40404.1 alpha/beta hydrolase [Streptomyces mobaraensis]UKW32985.1 alpha/beta hydrolase [Streptomyces sp. TYQ1024]
MKRDSVVVNDVGISFVEEGEGPLALLLHGFPESGEAAYRHVIPALAAAGYRAVAPNIRGFAPSALPADGSMRLADLVADANALHEALGGGPDAVVIGHDWGAATAWAVAHTAPERWARVVASDVPPLAFFGEYANTYEGIERLNHFWFFQMDMADEVLAADDMAWVRRVMQDKWTADAYDATADFEAVRKALGEPARLRAAIDLYRVNFAPKEMGTPEWAARHAALWGEVPVQPALYLHGTEDKSVVLDEAGLARIGASLSKGSEAAFIEGAGHLVPAEKPAEYTERVLAFLAKEV